MELERAIEIVTDLYRCPHMKGMSTQNDALKLLIEAGKYIVKARRQRVPNLLTYLLGETKEEL